MLEGIGEERVHFAMQEKSKPQMFPGIWCFLLAKNFFIVRKHIFAIFCHGGNPI